MTGAESNVLAPARGIACDRCKAPALVFTRCRVCKVRVASCGCFGALAEAVRCCRPPWEDEG